MTGQLQQPRQPEQPRRPQRVLENLNAALDAALDADPDLFLLGEDVTDPYGGAFKVTRGLSTRHPGQVLGTPISEAGVVGLANGLALAGNAAIVEIMFGDFVTLAFDQIVNFAAKSVSMYGRQVPMRLVVRCPSGGGRGYGPTHSQSLQKHFLGVPGLSVHELSPFHDNAPVLAGLLAAGTPAMFFEDKVLYGSRQRSPGPLDDLFRCDLVGDAPGVAWIRVDGLTEASDCVLVAPGGLVERALAAMRTLLLTDEIVCELLVPSRLHPLDPLPLTSAVSPVGRVCVVEDGTTGGTWGAEVAQALNGALRPGLRAPVRLVHGADRVVPTAPHLEREVLVGVGSICTAVREVVRG